jgi:hypothetical protein
METFTTCSKILIDHDYLKKAKELADLRKMTNVPKVFRTIEDGTHNSLIEELRESITQIIRAHYNDTGEDLSCETFDEIHQCVGAKLVAYTDNESWSAYRTGQISTAVAGCVRGIYVSGMGRMLATAPDPAVIIAMCVGSVVATNINSAMWG